MRGIIDPRHERQQVVAAADVRDRSGQPGIAPPERVDRSQNAAELLESAVSDLAARAAPPATLPHVTTLIRARFDPRSSRRLPRLLPKSPRYLTGDPRVAPTGRGAQTQTPAPFPEPSRPFLLDHSAEPLARMVGCSNHSEAGYRDQMASGGFSAVLALAISVLRRPAEC